MKKILTKTEQEKRKNRNQLIIGIILVGLMVLSTAGYALTSRSEQNSGGNSQSINYNGIQFIQESSDYWQFTLNGVTYQTTYNPDETKDINISTRVSLASLKDNTLYFVGDNRDSAISEIGSNLNSQVLRIQKACLTQSDCPGDYPIKDCSNDLIIFENSSVIEPNGISQRNNCIFVLSNDTEQVRYSDALLFKILNI